MNFRVDWQPTAQDGLARLWLASRWQSQITLAANLLDRQLSERPLEVGESRGGNRRIAFEAPLAITFQIDESDRRVLVLDVWEF